MSALFALPPVDSDIAEAVAATARAVGLPPGTRIVAAMSGGVDSTVAAALLARAGYEVIGVTLRLYDTGAREGRAGACCAGRDIDDARAAAARLGIAHYVLDYESRFREAVIDDFADSYLRGETPVPCIRCNQTVKFRDLADVARDLGAAALATGHYVRRELGRDGRPRLHRARDAGRDQSWFLFATTREQLDYLRFPIGDLPKPRVRALAGALGLGVADKPDSQDICFVPAGRYTTVIERLRPDAGAGGEIVHLDGRVMGAHSGVGGFTVGQRRGLRVATGEPLYVVRLDSRRREVIVGPREALLADAVALKETNWLGDDAFADACARERQVLARVRSTGQATAARLALMDEAPTVQFVRPEVGVAPGQACVLYDPDEPSRVLGGGFIAAVGPGLSSAP